MRRLCKFCRSQTPQTDMVASKACLYTLSLMSDFYLPTRQVSPAVITRLDVLNIPFPQSIEYIHVSTMRIKHLSPPHRITT